MESVKKISLLYIAFSFLLLPFQEAIFAQENNENVDNNNTETVLEGQERLDYLQVLEDSDLFNNTVSEDPIAKDTSQVIHMVPNVENAPIDEFIQIAGTIENSDKYGFIAVIDMEVNEVKRIINMEIDNYNETITLYDYNYDGTLVADGTMTFDEAMNDEGINNIETNNALANNPPDDPTDAWWFSWACNFTGVVGCVSGCVAFIPLGPVAYGVCTTACTYVWGSGLC